MIEAVVSMKIEVSNEKAYEELKRIEHHIEELLDLESWPEIQEVSDVHVEQDGFTKEDILSMFRSYVTNDAEAAELDYVQEALGFAGCSKEDAEKIGLGWVWPDDEEDE